MFKTILDIIGNTPLIESKVLNTNPNVKLLFKLEGHNPGGSVKDRAAYNMIKSYQWKHRNCFGDDCWTVWSQY